MAKVADYLETPPPGYDGRIATPDPTPDAFPGDHGGPAGRLVEFGSRDYAVVPVFDLRLSAGPGAYAEDRPEPLHYQVYEHRWLRRVTGAAVRDLMVGLVSGDSMEATLPPGDQVLLDRSIGRTSGRERGCREVWISVEGGSL